jgi:hypothetical protein
MRKVALAALRGLCWALSAAVVVAAFGASMVWVTGWLFRIIVDGGHGWKDTTARVFGALIAAPVAGICAGVVAGALVGAPLYGLLRLIGVHDPLRRRQRKQPVPPAPLGPPPPPYGSPSPYPYPAQWSAQPPQPPAGDSAG